MEKRKRSPRGCFWGLFILQSSVLAVLLLIVVVMVAADASFSPGDRRKLGLDQSPRMTEVWSWGQGDTKVVRIPLRGMILLGENDGFFPVLGSADMALKSIRHATHDQDVRAIIMDVDSGGGGITASDIIYKALLDFKRAAPGRKVVVIFGDVGASGALYVALAGDHIVAHPTTMTGSIGVMMQSFNLQEMAAKLGIRDVTIKSGANKDILNPLGELTDEQRRILQGMVEHLHDRFVQLVAEGRELSLRKVRELADGSVFIAADALELGLVDEIGYWEDAVAVTAGLLGVDHVKVFRYEQGFSLSSMFRSAAQWNPLSSTLNRMAGPKLMYRWEL